MVQQLCLIRDIYRTIAEFELQFEKRYSLCLNEAMLLCTLTEGSLSSGEIAEKLGLTNSNASKVIKSVEQKRLIDRVLGTKDKRQMYFLLTPEGKERIELIKCTELVLPELLTTVIVQSKIA